MAQESRERQAAVYEEARRLLASWTYKYQSAFQQRPYCVTHVTDADAQADLVKTDKPAAPIGFVTYVTQMTQVLFFEK